MLGLKTLRGAGLIFIFSLGISYISKADIIEFPEEELASESVMPVFDTDEVVKNRNVALENRFELGIQGGNSLTSVFYNPLSVAGYLGFHFNEEQMLQIFANYFLPGETGYVGQLNPAPGVNHNLNLQYAPRPKWFALAEYQATGYYGKISLTKQYVMNLTIYMLGGLGSIAIGDKNFPMASLGIGQKFYFNSQLALRFDLRSMFYQGPNIMSYDLSSAREEASASLFSNRFIIDGMISLGLTWVIPNFF